MNRLTLVWYDKREDKTFISNALQAYFFALAAGDWDHFVLLGEL